MTLTRPVGNLRMGIWTNDERWSRYIKGVRVSFETQDYLQEKFPCYKTGDNFWIDASVIPSHSIAEAITELETNEALYINGAFVALRSTEFNLDNSSRIDTEIENLVRISKRWHIYQKNGEVINADFELIKQERNSVDCSETNIIIGPRENLYIHETATVEGAIINVNAGPVYIGEHAEVMEGSVIRGPFALGNHAVLKLSAKVYGPTTIGTYCKVGGEVNNVVFQAYSNKGHDGFLGNSVIGEWCNIGADTNSSNLKNNYGNVKTYSFESGKIEQTDVQFMGLFMGDHSKTGINTMLNTATVIGISSTIFSSGFPPKYIPHFSWGGQKDDPVYDLEKAIDAANNMMKRRGKEITAAERMIFEKLYPNR